MAFKCTILLLGAAALMAGAAEKDKPKFTAGPVTDYPHRQTVEKVTVAAEPYITEEQTKTAFGKLNPNQHGLLPVLVVMRNDSGQVVSLERMQVDYVTAERERVEATPASEVKYLQAGGPRGVYTPPVPGMPPRVSRRKNPLNTWEIEGRAFAAKVLPPGESASGFVYFQAPFRKASSVVVKGLREAGSGRELFYFEIPFDK